MLSNADRYGSFVGKGTALLWGQDAGRQVFGCVEVERPRNLLASSRSIAYMGGGGGGGRTMLGESGLGVGGGAGAVSPGMTGGWVKLPAAALSRLMP